MRPFLLLMVLASCTNPDEIFPVRGLVVSPDPLEGQVVRLLRHVQTVIPGDYARCLPSEATPFKETQADVEGNYRFEVFRVEAESLVGYDSYCFRVDVRFPSGSTALSDFEQIRFETVVAPLRDWRAEPRLENGVLFFAPPVPVPDEPVATPDDPNPPLVTQVNHRAQVVNEDGAIAWQVDDRFREPFGTRPYFREPMVIDAVRLEDFSGAVVLRANVRVPDLVPSGFKGPVSTPGVDLVSGTRLAVSGARASVSRGLPCPPFAAPCPLTDGDLTPVDGGSVQEVSLALPSPRSLSTIVLRGLEAGESNVGVRLALEDGGVAALTGYLPANSAFGESSPAYVVIPIDAGVVRGVSLKFFEGLTRLQEISLFE